MPTRGQAYAYAKERYPVAKIVIWGELLGTGVAVALAAENTVDAFILEAPFTSTVDIAAAMYPIFPVRLLMKDQFHSDERIGKVSAPLLSCTAHSITWSPSLMARSSFRSRMNRRHSCASRAAAHEDLSDFGAVDAARKFLTETLK